MASISNPVSFAAWASTSDAIVSIDDPVYTTIDKLEGIEVPESGRLEISYAALFRVEGFVVQEAEDNFGDFNLFLDEEVISKRQGGGGLGSFIVEGDTEAAFWGSVRTTPEDGIDLDPPIGSDLVAHGAFYGPERLSIAATPGVHSVSFKARPGDPEGGTIQFKERRLVAITGSA